MKQKKSSVLEKIRPDLLVPPHVVDKLFHLFTGEWHPDTVQQEKLVTHLTECSPCRTLLVILLVATQKYEKSSGNENTFISDLLAQFVHVHYEIESQEYEQMGAYAEAIAEKGEKEADKRFPMLAEHIRTCPSCNATLKETLTFLRESKETY